MATAIEAPASIPAEGPTSHTPNQAEPSIYQLMSLVMRDVRNVGKDGYNDHQKYKFRGVDGAIGALAQPLRDHGVFMTPEVLDCESEVRGKMNAVRMRVAFHFWGPAGDKVTCITMGEASDTADKASNKAMSAALKYALIHTFMIPVDEGSLDDGDRDHPVAQRSPADAYVERLRKPAVWNNVGAIAAMHTEAKADGLLGATVQGPDGQTALGDMLVARGKFLKADAAQREERKTQEAPQAAAQVAAEHGAPTKAASPEPVADGPGEAPERKAQAAAHVERLMAQVVNCWDKPLSLSQVNGDAEKHGVLDEQVQGPGGAWMPLRELLAGRFAELKRLADEANSERNAA